MAILSVQTISTDGLVPVLSAITSTGDRFAGTEAEFLQVVNNSGSASVTVCISAQHKCTYLSYHNISEEVGIGSTKLLGKFATKWFNDGSDMVNITYSPSNITGISIGVFHL